MTNSKIEWCRWLRAAAQLTTFFGLGMIVLVWGAVEFHLNAEHEQARLSAIRSTTNLARLFEDHIIRVIKANDRILRELQLSSVNGTLPADFNRLASEVDDSSEGTAPLSIFDASGILSTTTFGPVAQPLDISDREHFKVHVRDAEAGLLISEPVMGRISKRWSILLSRALRAPHGQFAGTVVASISADKLARFYEIVDLGRNGAINLVGLDGIVRASAGMQIPNVGRSMRNTELLRHAEQADEGWFSTPGTVDGIKRIMAFRKVDGYPLILAVGRAESDVYGNYLNKKETYHALAFGLTLFILAIIAVNIRHHRSLERARQSLRASEMREREKSRELALTLEHMSQGIMMVDARHKVAIVNRRAIELLDLPEFVHSRPDFAQVMAHHMAHDEYGKDGGLVAPQLWEAIKSGDLYGSSAYERTRPNGVTLEVSTTPLPDGGIVRTFTDVSERKRSEKKIAHMAHHDPLTGLANRVLLRSHIETALGRQRRQGERFALLVIDLDRFKFVNDSLGHAAGDELLRVVAQRLQECVREVDTVARLGGDEFAVLQVGTEEQGSIETLARRILDKISDPYSINGQSAHVGTSIGIARCEDAANVEELFHHADLALYRVKSEGRNGFRVFEAKLDAEMQERRRMEAELRRAMVCSEFEIYYQPVVHPATRKIASVEALLRWNHPRHGRIAPVAFMPIAEEIGLMPQIDTWVLDTASAEAALWPKNVRIAVNLSPAKFKRRNLAAVVQRALAQSRLPPHRLELEISERILLREDERDLEQLRALQETGVRLALDDFGTGHTSLGDLRALRFDTIKIDRSFVAEMEGSVECAAIVAAIAGLGRSLGAETTAEGVETQTQAELVRAAGCTQAQGYFYSYPLTAEAIKALLTEPSVKLRTVA